LPGYHDLEAHNAALSALQALWPLPDREAHLEVARAIYYASVEHAAWFWGRKERYPTVRMYSVGVSVIRSPLVRATSMAQAGQNLFL
jgi:hypothetical protein